MTEIISTSDTLGGKPRIEGTRVSAEQIYEMYLIREMEPKEIAEELPTVNLEGVEAAIEYIRDKFRTFLRKNPEKRTRVTLELYKNGKISLMRAAELAEMDLESYKEELKERGITVKTHKGSEEEKEEVEKRL